MKRQKSSRPKTNKPGISPRLQAALDQLSKQPSPQNPKRGSLAEYEERMDGWMDRALERAAKKATSKA